MFWGELLSRRFSVIGWSRNRKTGLPRGINQGSEEEVLSCDIVFFCVSISAFKEVLQKCGKKIGPGTLVADTCSVKMVPIRWMMEHLPADVKILGTHPMFGPDSGKNGIHGLPIVLSPARLLEEDLERWTEIFRELGLEVFRMSAEEHDHQAAYSQGITHFIGRVVDDLGLEQFPISTIGFKKMLEVAEQTCNDPFQLFLDLQRYNPYTGEMRRKLQKSLSKMMSILESETAENPHPVLDTG